MNKKPVLHNKIYVRANTPATSTQTKAMRLSVYGSTQQSQQRQKSQQSNSNVRQDRILMLSKQRDSQNETILSQTIDVDQRRVTDNKRKLIRGHSLYVASKTPTRTALDLTAFCSQKHNDEKVKFPSRREARIATDIFQMSQASEFEQRPIDSQQRSFLDKPSTVEKIRQSMHTIAKKLKEQDIYELRYLSQLSQLKLDEHLTLEEFEYLKVELEKKDHERNYETIDEILIKNKFFQRFEKGVRIGIIEKCQFTEKKMGDVLFRDEPDRMYIILQGSCSLQLTIFTDTIQTLTILSYYIGQHINESNLVKKEVLQQEEESAELTYIKQQGCEVLNSQLIVQEDSYLLSLKNDCFQNILIQSIERDLQPKLNTLSRIRILKNIPHKELVPLAAIISVTAFTQSDYVVKKGQQLNHLIIVHSGELEVVIETRIRRDLPIRNQKLVPFQYKNHCDSGCQTNKTQPQPKYYTQSSKGYQYGNKKVLKNKIEYNQQNSVQVYRQGDILCARAILMHKFDDTMGNAKLSIVCKSVNAQVYLLDYKQFTSLPEPLQNQIIAGLQTLKEHDNLDVQQQQAQIIKWEQFKEDFYKSIKFGKQQNYKIY